jgi:H+/Cl- antiporter ClcA
VPKFSQKYHFRDSLPTSQRIIGTKSLYLRLTVKHCKMLYPFITLGLLAAFVGYILYHAIYRKDLKSKMNTVVLPGLFFVAVWIVLYIGFLR